MPLKHACSLCGCRTPRADCLRCGARQPSLFDLPRATIPDDAEVTTIDEIASASLRSREIDANRLARLASLARPVTVGLVGCAKTKRAEPLPCRQLYKSPLFVAALAHAERTCDETYVVSAAHGLLALDQVVAPYDRSLGDLPKKERLAWGSRVADAVRARFPGLSLHLVILAGLEYAAPIRWGTHPYGWVIETPLAKKSIGQRLAWFREQAPALEKPRKRTRGAS